MAGGRQTPPSFTFHSDTTHPRTRQSLSLSQYKMQHNKSSIIFRQMAMGPVAGTSRE